MRRSTIAVVLAALATAGCSSSGNDADGRVRVVAAFYPLAEAARQVGGDLVRVDDLTPPGVEPHDIEVTPDDVDAIEDADLVLYVSGGFQPAIEEVAERRSDEAVDLLPDGSGDDPHFWLDPRSFRDAVDRIADELARARPSARATFERRAAAYGGELAALDDEIATTLATCARRTFVTGHDAFGHLARRYRLEQEAIAGLSPESEPDADRLAELADLVEQTGVTTVFTETLVSPRVARTLAREADVEVAVLDPIEGLADDDGDYLSVMRANTAALADALACTS